MWQLTAMARIQKSLGTRIPVWGFLAKITSRVKEKMSTSLVIKLIATRADPMSSGLTRTAVVGVVTTIDVPILGPCTELFTLFIHTRSNCHRKRAEEITTNSVHWSMLTFFSRLTWRWTIQCRNIHVLFN